MGKLIKNGIKYGGGSGGSSIELDTTLTKAGAAADAKAVGDALENQICYAVCETAAATVEKVVTCNNFKLQIGTEIIIKFTITNTASNPTLNINNTGALPIYYKGSAILNSYLQANTIHTFVYTGTAYELIGADLFVRQQYFTAPSYAPILVSGAAQSWGSTPTSSTPYESFVYYVNKVYVNANTGRLYAEGGFDGTVAPDDIVNDLTTAVAVTDTQTPVGCGVAKELNEKMLQIVSFDESTGTLITKSSNYTG